MAKKTTDDGEGAKAKKGPKPLRVATVVKPCLLGAGALMLVQLALTAVSP